MGGIIIIISGVYLSINAPLIS